METAQMVVFCWMLWCTVWGTAALLEWLVCKLFGIQMVYRKGARK